MLLILAIVVFLGHALLPLAHVYGGMSRDTYTRHQRLLLVTHVIGTGFLVAHALVGADAANFFQLVVALLGGLVGGTVLRSRPDASGSIAFFFLALFAATGLTTQGFAGGVVLALIGLVFPRLLLLGPENEEQGGVLFTERPDQQERPTEDPSPFTYDEDTSSERRRHAGAVVEETVSEEPALEEPALEESLDTDVAEWYHESEPSPNTAPSAAEQFDTLLDQLNAPDPRFTEAPADDRPIFKDRVEPSADVESPAMFVEEPEPFDFEPRSPIKTARDSEAHDIVKETGGFEAAPPADDALSEREFRAEETLESALNNLVFEPSIKSDPSIESEPLIGAKPFIEEPEPFVPTEFTPVPLDEPSLPESPDTPSSGEPTPERSLTEDSAFTDEPVRRPVGSESLIQDLPERPSFGAAQPSAEPDTLELTVESVPAELETEPVTDPVEEEHPELNTRGRGGRHLRNPLAPVKQTWRARRHATSSADDDMTGTIYSFRRRGEQLDVELDAPAVRQLAVGALPSMAEPVLRDEIKSPWLTSERSDDPWIRLRDWHCFDRPNTSPAAPSGALEAPPLGRGSYTHCRRRPELLLGD